MLIHHNDNPRFTLNDKVLLFTLPCQIIVKIIMLNILLNSEDYGKTRGCITRLVYYIMRDLPVTLLKLIFDIITAENFDNRNLPYDMLFNILFDFWSVDLSED